jgi:hypothetical protein
MEQPRDQITRDQGKSLDLLLRRSLLLDLEVSHQDEILKVGAALADATLARSGDSSLATSSHLIAVARTLPIKPHKVGYAESAKANSCPPIPRRATG